MPDSAETCLFDKEARANVNQHALHARDRARNVEAGGQWDKDLRALFSARETLAFARGFAAQRPQAFEKLCLCAAQLVEGGVEVLELRVELLLHLKQLL